MATVQPPVDARADDVDDVGVIWKEAIVRYEINNKCKIQSLDGASSVNEILIKIRNAEKNFDLYRHDGSRLNRLMTLVSKSLNLVDKISNVVASAASTSFPPSTAIFTAVHYFIDCANNVSADYDQIAEFFEDVDLYLSRLKILEEEIPPVPELKIALARVLTSVLDLCGICAKYVKMKRIRKTFRNLLSGEDDELKKAYKHFHKMVDQEEGAIKNVTLAYVLRMDKRQSEGREAALERDEILQELSSLKFHDKQKVVFDKHHQGTCQWLLSTDEFQKWFKGDQNSILWCPGIPGAGKTVMTSMVVNHIAEATRRKEAAIACVYCDYKDARTKSEVELISSITRQLAEQIIPLPPEVKAFHDKNIQARRRPTHDERISLLKFICRFFQTVYVCIDALDECPEENRDIFLQLIRRLEPSIRMFVTSRLNVDLQMEFTNICRVEIRADSSDMEVYLKSEINRNKRLRELTAEHPNLEEEIVKKVRERAAGMFLFAYLQIGRLCQQTSLRMVRERLNALPTGLPAIYEDDIKRIDEQSEENSQLAKRALSYIFCARRLLHVEELRHALAVEPGDTTLDDDAFPKAETLLKVSAGLIELDHTSNIVRSCTYLHTERTTGKTVSRSNLVLFMSQHYWGLDETLIPLLEKGIDVNNQDSYGATALQIAAKNGKESVVRLLLVNKAIVNTENETGETALYLAARNGHVDIVKLLLAKGANVMTKDSEGWNALDWAVVEGRNDVIKVLMEQGFDAKSDGRYKALYLAAGEGHEETVQMLLDHGADVNERDWMGSTALDWAAPAGHETTVRLLLRKGADFNSRDVYENTALHWAVQHEAIVELLLEYGADINAKNDRGQTPLCWVARDGPVVVAQLLVEHNANVNVQDEYGCTALHGAALKGREGMLQLLLKQGANPNAKDKDGWTCLHVAALKRHQGIVQVLLEKTDDGAAILDWAASQQQSTKKRAVLEEFLEKKAEGSTVLSGLRVAVQENHMTRLQALLDKGADVNAQDVGGWTALILAASYGSKDAVQLLIQYGADVNSSGGRAWSALHWASENREEAVVQLLIESGADVNASKNEWTPMLLAAKKGCLAIVQSLVNNGANVNAEDYHGRRALHWAAGAGHREMMWLLVGKGANLDAVDRWGRTALMWAIESMQTVALLLLGIGANVRLKAWDGSTALHLAAFKREEIVTQQLLKKGAGIEEKTEDGFTALHIAAFMGCETVVQLLIANGAKVETEARWCAASNRDEQEDSVIETAEVKSLSKRLWHLFLERGTVTDVKLEAQQILTARQLADSGGHIEVQRLLIASL